jgi:hypothetical protein
MDERIIWVYLIEALEGMQYLHANDVLHRGRTNTWAKNLLSCRSACICPPRCQWAIPGVLAHDATQSHEPAKAFLRKPRNARFLSPPVMCTQISSPPTAF